MNSDGHQSQTPGELGNWHVDDQRTIVPDGLNRSPDNCWSFAWSILGTTAIRINFILFIVALIGSDSSHIGGTQMVWQQAAVNIRRTDSQFSRRMKEFQRFGRGVASCQQDPLVNGPQMHDGG